MPVPDPNPSSPHPPSGNAGGVTVNAEQHGDAVALVVTGELDMLSTPKLDEMVTTALRGKPQVLVIDLTGVTFLASAGMAALVSAQQAAGENTTVRVVATGRATARSLQVVGLDEQLPIHPTLDEALAAGR
ncbi:STAS domain-containing protein [Prauserella flavalba]|uniref:Anti-sigma factor antagonist n=1 Tax=Prauserella flavalba TaxID=1477506 RepID=A0A318LU28_9PSEU|nr:STAS domain-containing protein [Prauserella flavalba]PXY35897.1 hypothetical protein BA062_10545 [Prauserella flavalba]